MIIRKFIDQYFLVGATSRSKTTRERIILANVIFLAVPIVIFISYLIHLQEYIVPVDQLNFDQFTRLMFGVASLICYYLNRKELFNFSRWLYLASWIAFWLVLDPVIQGTSTDYYFHFDLSIIGLSLVTQILVSFKREPIIFTIAMLFSLVCIFFQQSYLLHFDSNKETAKILFDNAYTYQTSIYYWAIFNLIIGYLLYIYEKSNIHLAENNQELDRLTSNLEEVVAERTEDLQSKQDELIAVANQLKESQEKYRKLFTNSFEGIAQLELDPPLDTTLPKSEQVAYLIENLKLVECNDVFAQLYLEKNPKELIGKQLGFIMDHKASITNLMEAYVAQEYRLEGITMEESIHDTDRWFISHITSHIEENKVQWLWLNKLDITEKSKQDLERKVLLSHLEEYAFQTSHELRGPLSRLLGLTSLMLNKNAFNKEELPEMLKHINDTSLEIDDVIKMMNQVLSNSQYESKLTKSRTSKS